MTARSLSVALVAALVSCLFASAASAEGESVDVRFCGGGVYQVRYGICPAWITLGPGLTASMETDVCYPKGQFWISTTRVSTALIVVLNDRGDPRPPGETVVFAPSPVDLTPSQVRALRHSTPILIADISDYKKALRLIRATWPDDAVIAAGTNTPGAERLLREWPQVLHQENNTFGDVLHLHTVPLLVTFGPRTALCDLDAETPAKPPPMPSTVPTRTTPPTPPPRKASSKCGCFAVGESAGAPSPWGILAIALAAFIKRRRTKRACAPPFTNRTRCAGVHCGHQ